MEEISIYNQRLESILKAIEKKEGKIDSVIHDQAILQEKKDNEMRFTNLLKRMIIAQESVQENNARKIKHITRTYNDVVDRTLSMLGKNTGDVTRNFCLRRAMYQNQIIIGKIIMQIEEIEHGEKNS